MSSESQILPPPYAMAERIGERLNLRNGRPSSRTWKAIEQVAIATTVPESQKLKAARRAA